MNNNKMGTIYLKQEKNFQRVYYSYPKLNGFVPETGSEIYVRNIPPTAEDLDLIKHFEQAGQIYQIRFMISCLENKEKRNFLYVTYKNSDTAKKAVKMLDKKEFQSHRLLMEISVNNCRIFVGGIPVNSTRDQVWLELKRKRVRNIVDVIMYRSYTDRAENRGFIFVEFRTHEEAAYFRAKYHENLELFGTRVVVDWSVPLPEIDPEVMKEVKIIYLRNLDVWEDRQQLEMVVTKFIAKERLEKLYKFKNYAFIHLKTRMEADILIKCLKEYYKNEPVDVEWAKPATKFTKPEYRQRKVETMTRNSSQSSVASGSSSGRNSATKMDLVCTSGTLNYSDLPNEMTKANEFFGCWPPTSPTPPSTPSASTVSPLSPIPSTHGSLFSPNLSASNSLEDNFRSLSPFSPNLSPSSSLEDSFRSFSPFRPSSTSSPRLEHNAHQRSQLDEHKRMTLREKILKGAIKVPAPMEFMNNVVKNKGGTPLVFGQLPCAIPDTSYMTDWMDNPSRSSQSSCNVCGFMGTSQP